jgi:hypothetical protein
LTMLRRSSSNGCFDIIARKDWLVYGRLSRTQHGMREIFACVQISRIIMETTITGKTTMDTKTKFAALMAEPKRQIGFLPDFLVDDVLELEIIFNLQFPCIINAELECIGRDSVKDICRYRELDFDSCDSLHNYFEEEDIYIHYVHNFMSGGSTRLRSCKNVQRSVDHAWNIEVSGNSSLQQDCVVSLPHGL